MIDLNKFKGKTLGDAETAEIQQALDAEKARAEAADEAARAAKRESIDGRKKLKAERDKAFEKLGITEADELEGLKDAKGQAEAAQQYEARIKKLERDLGEANTVRDQVTGQLSGLRREAAITEGIEGLNFRNPADVRVLLGTRVVQEGDAFLFKTDEGKLVPIKEGAAWFAKTRPDYVQPADAGGQGSGFKGNAAGGGTGTQGNWGGDRKAREAAIAERFNLPAN